MAERFEPANAVIIKCIQEKVTKNDGAEKSHPATERNIMGAMPFFCEEGHQWRDERPEKERMGKPAVGQEVIRGTHPKRSNKVDVGYALGEDAPEHGFTP